MDRVSRQRRRRRCPACAQAAVALAASVIASVAGDALALAPCAPQAETVLVVGAPQEYAAALLDPGTGAVTPETPASPCAMVAAGSDYQVLDWLENGGVDAGILSPFALKLLQLASADHFGGDFRVFKLPTAARTGVSRDLFALRYREAGEWQPRPRQHYERYLADAGAGAATVPIYVPSHLSAGLAILIDYTRRWLGEERARIHGATSSPLWQRFVAALRLRLSPSLPAPQQTYFEVVALGETSRTRCAEAGLACLPSPGLADYLVVRSYAPVAATLEPAAPDLSLWDQFIERSQIRALEPSLRRFFERNYELRLTAGIRKRRHFRFTVDELWRILQTHVPPGRNEGFALVLTGGGVKAAYQTELIDRFYREGRLRNVYARGQPPSGPSSLRVDYVIGTSGGALLGVFVAALDRLPGSLVDMLWRRPADGEYLSSADVFPFVEMLRYASAIIAGIVFAVVCSLGLNGPWKTLRGRLRPPADRRRTTDERSHLRWVTVPWVSLLVIAPWIIKPVTGEAGLEHVPVIAGLFYAAFIFLAVYADNRLIFPRQSRPEPPDRSWTRYALLALYALGAVLTFLPFAFDATSYYRAEFLRFDRVPWLGAVLAGLGGITLGTLTTCMGLLGIALALLGSAARRADKVGADEILWAGTILVGIPVLCELALALAGVTLFELTVEFWQSLLAASLLISFLALLLGRTPLLYAPIRRRLSAGLDLLFELHPRRTLFFQARRYARATIYLCCAWLWWNFINAPGLYGNEKAKTYFENTIKTFLDAEGRDGISFTAPLIISATSLNRNREVYFLVDPEPPAGLAAPSMDLPTVETDPRWIRIGPRVEVEDLRAVAFASGSPFPVFPMTKVRTPPLDTPAEGAVPRHDPDGAPEGEWLVDGGFAHNIPIDAARQIGAARILVVSSSPLHDDDSCERAPADAGSPSADAGTSAGQATDFVGGLVVGLPRLLPYLYERSQIEDVLGTQEVLVGAISPALEPCEDWPLLTDFRAPVIERVVAAARRNLERNARVGTVESWGPPICSAHAGPRLCQELRRLVSSIPR